jgi:hypothetical protein
LHFSETLHEEKQQQQKNKKQKKQEHPVNFQESAE